MKGFGPTSYLIARGRPASAHYWDQPYITYTPPAAEGDLHWVGSYDDHVPHSAGGECSPQDFLARPGLVKMIERLGGGWFLPFMQRLSEGEVVPLEEIADVYQRHHGSRIESKPLGTRLFPCEQAASDWAIANPPLQRCLVDVISQAAHVANANWKEWKRGTARSLHHGLEACYLGEPPVAVIIDTTHRQFLNCCHQAWRAAEREGLKTRAAKLAALSAPAIKALGKESYQTLFGHLR